MWTKLSADKKSELMKAYKKGGFSYRDMIDDYNTSYEKFDLGGETDNLSQPGGATLPKNDATHYYTSDINDPRIKSYNDSVNVFIKGNKDISEFNKNIPYITNNDKPGYYKPNDVIDEANDGYDPMFAPTGYLTHTYNKNTNTEDVGPFFNTSGSFAILSGKPKGGIDSRGQETAFLPIYKKPTQQVYYQPKPKPAAKPAVATPVKENKWGNMPYENTSYLLSESKPVGYAPQTNKDVKQGVYETRTHKGWVSPSGNTEYRYTDPSGKASFLSKEQFEKESKGKPVGTYKMGGIQRFDEGGKTKPPRINMSLMDQPNFASETVQSQVAYKEDPFVKANNEAAAVERNRLAYIEQEKQRKANEDKVRSRIRAQQELDIKNKVPGKELYNEDFLVNRDIARTQYQDKIENATNISMGIGAAALAGITAPLWAPAVAGAAGTVGAALEAPAVIGNTTLPWLTGNNAMAAYFGSKIPQNIKEGEYLEAGLNALPFLGPGKTALREAVNASKESGVLSNAYKLNPFAFKPNPENIYRGIGKGGMEDALQSGIIRNNPNKFSNEGIRAGLENGSFRSPYFVEGKNFNIAEKYGNGYIAETPLVRNAETGELAAYPAGDNWGWTGAEKEMHLKDFNILKKHWLQGYKKIPKELPGSPNAVSSVDDVVTQLRNELSEKGIISQQKTLNLPWKEPIRIGIEPWAYSDDMSLFDNVITGSKFKDVKGVITGGKNPSYLSDEEYLMKVGDYDVKNSVYNEEMQEFLKNKPVLSNEKNIKDALNLRDKNRLTGNNDKLTKNRYATWDMYLGKPQTEHPMYDISKLTKSKDDVIYTIKEDFINKEGIEDRFEQIFDVMNKVEDNPAEFTRIMSSRKKNNPSAVWQKKDNSFIIPDKDNNMFGTMGGFHWNVEKMADGNYKAIANDVWDLQPLKFTGIPFIKNIEAGKALGVGKPLNVKVGFIIDGKTKKIINTFGLSGAIGAVGLNQNKTNK